MTDNLPFPQDKQAAPKYYSTKQVSEMFDVQPYTVRVWIKSKKLRAIRLGNKLKVEHQELVRFANERYVD